MTFPLSFAVCHALLFYTKILNRDAHIPLDSKLLSWYNILKYLQGGVKFPTGGKARERSVYDLQIR